MAWGDKRDLIIAENASKTKEIEILREVIDDLKRDKIELKKQLVSTQEALICKEAPEAYRDQKDLEEKALMKEPTEEQLKARNIRNIQAETATRYLQEMEKSLFLDADDMVEKLMPSVGVPLAEHSSLHDNEES